MPTLLDVLRERFPDSSTTTLRQMLQNDRVLVNGRAERNAKREIVASDHVDCGESRRTVAGSLRILHEDADLVVIDKPAGLLTVPGRNSDSSSAESLLNARYGARANESRVHVVQRLDRDTSGVLVFARNTFARDRLQELFAAHDVERAYVAILHGRLDRESGTYRSFLVEDSDLRVSSTADASAGKEAITHWQVAGSNERYTLVRVTLETGRRNQIRVHFSEAGHPVVGDAMYGRGEKSPIERLALHAEKIGFAHPRSGKVLTFTSPLPRELADFAKREKLL